MPIDPEWIRQNERQLTAKEVRELPEGTKVTLLSQDAWGCPARLNGRIMLKGKTRVFHYSTPYHFGDKDIKQYHNKAWLIKEDGGNGNGNH